MRPAGVPRARPRATLAGSVNVTALAAARLSTRSRSALPAVVRYWRTVKRVAQPATRSVVRSTRTAPVRGRSVAASTCRPALSAAGARLSRDRAPGPAPPRAGGGGGGPRRGGGAGARRRGGPGGGGAAGARPAALRRRDGDDDRARRQHGDVGAHAHADRAGRREVDPAKAPAADERRARGRGDLAVGQRREVAGAAAGARRRRARVRVGPGGGRGGGRGGGWGGAGGGGGGGARGWSPRRAPGWARGGRRRRSHRSSR